MRFGTLLSHCLLAAILGLAMGAALAGEPAPLPPLQYRTHAPAFYVKLPGEAAQFLARAGRISAVLDRASVNLETPQGQVRVLFPGASDDVRLVPGSATGGTVSFIGGTDPSEWRTGQEIYSSIRYVGLWRGIDLIYGDTGRLLKSEFRVAEGADPAAIRLRYEGATSVELGPDGALIIKLPEGELREDAPVAYQEAPEGRRSIVSSFEVSPSGEVSFRVGEYDRDLPLIIDPTLSFSAYIGGSGADTANAIALDAAGDVYVCGQTESGGLSAAGGAQTKFGGSVDAWVAKFNHSTGALVFLTYLGGSAQDFAQAIAVGSDGAPVIAGYTYSANFPVKNAEDAIHHGDKEAYVAKLSATGSALVYATLLGGAQADIANAVAMDTADAVFVVGETRSSDFPVRNAVQGALRGNSDAFVAEFDSAGKLLFSTFAGGSGEDRGLAVATDRAGGIYFGGATASSDFPVKGAAQQTLKGSEDGFVARLHPASGYSFATYLGGSAGSATNPERVYALASDANGYVYAAGATPSPDFPTIVPYQSTLLGGQDAFLAKFSPSGAMVFSTYFGGITNETAFAVAVDIEGTAYIAGKTDSESLPMQNAAQAQKGGAADGFLARFSANGANLMLGTYLGGAGSDSIRGVAVQDASEVWVAGQTQSANFPIIGAASSSGSAEGEGFIAKLFQPAGPMALLVTPASGSGTQQTFTFTYQHSSGASSLAVVYGWIDGRASTVNSCVWRYDTAANALALLDDAGTTYSAGATPGAAATLANTQCAINVATSVVSSSGKQLSVSLNISFKGNFYGPMTTYAYATDKNNATSDKTAVKGTWTVPIPPKPPSAVSVSPNSGGGATATFTYVATDPNGWADLHFLYGVFDTSVKTQVTCLWKYDVANRRLSLMGDSGTTYVGALSPGGTQTLANSQCTIASAWSVSTSGNTLTLAIPITFASTFGGTKNLYLAVEDYGASTGYRNMGYWTIPGTANPVIPQAPPTINGVTPNSGTGASATFAYSVTDVNGASDLRYLYGYFDTAYKLSGTCFWRFDPITRKLWLMNDSASGYLGPISPGSSEGLSNSQCTIAGSYTVSTTTNDLTLSLPVTFMSTFTGTKNIVLAAEDQVSSTGYRTIGSWTIPAAAPLIAPPLLPSPGLQY